MDVNFVAINNQKYFSNPKKSQKVSSPFAQSTMVFNNIPKKRKASRGRPRKNTQESSSSQEYEYEENDEYYNNKDCKTCPDGSPISISSQPKIRKISDNTIKQHSSNYFQNESQQSEYVNIDHWNNYENAVNENNGIINLCEDSGMCNSNYIDSKGGIIVDSNNEFTEEYERNSENNNLNLSYQTQPMISETGSYNNQHFFQNTNDFHNSQDYATFNHSFKGFDRTSSDKNVFSDIYVSQQHSQQSLINQQYIPCKKSGNDAKISNKDVIYSKNLTRTSNSSVYNSSPQLKNLKYSNPNIPRIIEVNNNISSTEEKFDLSNTIEISDHSYSTPYMTKQSEINSASNIDLKDETESFNHDSINMKNSQTENAVNIFDDIQNIDFRYDVSEEISSTLEEYFNSLDFPSNSDTPKMRMTPKPEANIDLANDWVNSQTQKQWDVPFVPMAGTITSMICPICDWFGKVPNFGEHVRMKHPKFIFKTTNGYLSISINIDDIRKCANSSQQFFIEHEKNLYIIHFKYKYPDIIVPIILFVNGANTMGNPLAKFLLQVNNLVKRQETIWTGIIECLNGKGRPSMLMFFLTENMDVLKFL